MCFSWTRKWAKSGEIVQNRPGSCFSWPRQTAPRSRCGGAAGTARNARCGAQSGIATRHARFAVATRCGLRSRITAISQRCNIIPIGFYIIQGSHATTLFDWSFAQFAIQLYSNQYKVFAELRNSQYCKLGAVHRFTAVWSMLQTYTYR